MSRRRVVVTVCIATILLAVGRVGFLLASPWIVLETTTVRVQDDGRNAIPIPFRVTVTNRSLRTLVVSKVSSSCSCVSAQLASTIIPPFKKTELEGSVFLGGRLAGEGKFLVAIATNSVLQKPKQVVIEWQRRFVGGVVASPERVVVEGREGSVFSRSVDLFVSPSVDSLSLGVNTEGVVGRLLAPRYGEASDYRHFVLEISGPIPLGPRVVSNSTVLVKATSHGVEEGEATVEIAVRPKDQ